MIYKLIYLLLKFVARQPTCINIVFGYKQAQKCSRIHKLDFARAVSWSTQCWIALVVCADHSYSRTHRCLCIL